MNKHEQLCKECAAQAGLTLSPFAAPIREWRAVWVVVQQSNPGLGLLHWLDNGCMVCHNNDEGLITDCVINVEVDE